MSQGSEYFCKSKRRFQDVFTFKLLAKHFRPTCNDTQKDDSSLQVYCIMLLGMGCYRLMIPSLSSSCGTNSFLLTDEQSTKTSFHVTLFSFSPYHALFLPLFHIFLLTIGVGRNNVDDVTLH